MVIPNWLTKALLTLNTSHARNRGEFILDDEPITLEFLDTSQVAVVKSHHRGRNFIPGGVVWVKKVAPNGVTLLEVQYFGKALSERCGGSSSSTRWKVRRRRRSTG